MPYSPHFVSNSDWGSGLSWGDKMNPAVLAAQRHIADIEARIIRQARVVEMRTKAGLDSRQAERTLRILEQALGLTREHVRILLPAAAREATG
jgi:hypothetical protein